MPENPLPEEESDLGETLDRLILILTTRRWWIIATAGGITLAAIAVLWMLPNRYTSDATLVVVAQQVPQRYVVPNSTADLNSTLQAMKQEVLSRTRLLRMINDFRLYPHERERLAPEQLVSLMLTDIDITPLGEHPQEKNFDAFRVSFTAQTALLAQQVTSTLTSLFINEHMRTQEEQSTNTTKFLHDQVTEKKTRLEDQEQRLREFKMKYVGELPEQQQGNLGILTGLQTQLQNTVNGLNHAEQQRAYLQSLMEAQKRPDNPTRMARVLSPVEVAQDELAKLESQRATLLTTKTSAHPDVIKIQREIAKAEDTVKRLKAIAAPSERSASPSASASDRAYAESAADPALAQLKSQLESNRLEIEGLSRDEKRLKATIAQYENRLNQTPVREQQQAGIVRETEALRQEYADLQKKEQESQLATNLEKQQGGQQFRLVDPASLPLVPSSPKRAKLSLVSAMGGIFLGFGLAFLREMKDVSLRSEKELTQRVAAPFVVEIPMLRTRNEERRLRWQHAFELLAGSAVVLIVALAEYYVYKNG
jgi:succinoglycan biosynthesis transport protein ExoP